MFFRMLYDDKLAQASYIIGCQATGEALVIDPERDVDRYIRFVENEGMRIVAIAETHIHADFLSGVRELAEKTGARVYVSDEGDASWKYQWLDKKSDGGSYDYHLLKNGDTFTVGNIQVQAIHTPGHTPEHLCFLVTDRGGGATEPIGIATGDFVFVRDVGRPDLLETAAGQQGAKEPSARTLFQSLQWFKKLPDFLQVWPGHGAGSACGKALGAVPQSTVGYEKRFNAALAFDDEEEFVRFILEGQPEPPLYFARMKKENKEGPAILGQLPQPKRLAVDTLLELVEQGAVIVDTREWEAYRQAHLKGALYAPLSSAFPSIVGSYIEPDQPIYLIVEDHQVHEAVVDLIRIGLDRVVGYAPPAVLAEVRARGGRLVQTPYIDIESLNNQSLPEDTLLLDVRNISEFQQGHLPGAYNIAYTRLVPRLNELPRDRKIWVYCRTNNRSAAAAGYLERQGFDVTHLSGGILSWQLSRGELVRETPENTAV